MKNGSVVALPDSPENNNPTSAQDTDASAGDKFKIMIVDDNESIAKLFARMLELIGYEVRYCHDGAQAIKLAAEYKPRIALIDIGLPDMTGHEVGKELRKLDKANGFKLKMIAITGFDQEDDYRRSTEAGFDLHLVKPVNMDTLEKILAGFSPTK